MTEVIKQSEHKPGECIPIKDPNDVEFINDLDNDNRDNYSLLLDVLDDAFHRAATGKGRERHANDLPFDQQPIVTECAILGIAGNVQQIRKKALECVRLPNNDAKICELLDVIVYAAATVIALRKI